MGSTLRGGHFFVGTTNIDQLSEPWKMLCWHPSHIHVWMINLARGTDQLDRLTVEPLKPSVLHAVKRSQFRAARASLLAPSPVGWPKIVVESRAPLRYKVIEILNM